MTHSQIIALVLSSAGLATLISSAVAFLTAWAERRTRKKEILLTKSIELAQLHTEFLIRAADKSGKAVNLLPYIVTARWFHSALKGLFENDRLPEYIEMDFKDYFETGQATPTIENLRTKGKEAT